MKALKPDDLVHSGLLKWAEAAPHRVALSFNGKAISFAELAQHCALIGAAFERRHARLIGVCLPNCATVIEVFFAALMAGGSACIFDPTWPPTVLKKLVQDHAPNLLIAPPKILQSFGDALAKEQSLAPEEIKRIASKTGNASVLKSEPTPDTPFLIGFTSGSSGTPKGFVRSHQTWVDSFRHSAIELGTHAGDIVMAPGPLSHGLSLYAAIEAISAGASVIIQSEFDALSVLDAIAGHQATVLVVVPAMLDVLIGSADGKTYPSIDRIVTAGAKLSPQLRANVKRTFSNADTIEYYGASELSFITVAKASELCPPGSVGRAFSGVEISLGDRQGGSVETGEVGTIWVKSSMISSGYVGPTDGSGFRTDRPWATVGDLGHFDNQGFLYLDGREGSVITSAGYTVYPSAIEAILREYSGVIDVAVIGLPDSRWGEVIAAAIVLKQKTPESEQRLADHCKCYLEPYACPRRWRFVKSLERTASGKTNQSSLAKLFS
ncbi:MAG: AMP-binding protein [Rhodospirillaceae bacterium]|nr:AMP-binding protein [Rhodospirillaceae bacterium]